MDSLVQPFTSISHLYPIGQQCFISLQHTASLYGQQAHVESDSLQQLCVFEQRVVASHITSSSSSKRVRVRVIETLCVVKGLIQVAA